MIAICNSLLLILASQLLKLNKNDEAESIYRELVKRNPENNAYYAGVEKCLEAKGNCKFLNKYLM